MEFALILKVLAVLFFVMSGFGVPKYNWMCFGFACLTLLLLFKV